MKIIFIDMKKQGLKPYFIALTLGLICWGCTIQAPVAELSPQAPVSIIHINQPGECYDMLYHVPCKQAQWIRYTLTPEKLNGSASRKDNFKPDPRIDITYSARNADYSKSGYDRGHLAPAADMSFSQSCMDQSFYLSNMSPQTAGCNRGVWKRLEQAVRNWAEAHDSLLIYTGPDLSRYNELPSIGQGSVCVPEQYFKAILFYTQGNVSALGFVIPNESSSLPLIEFAWSIDQIEEYTGLDFFNHLPDTTELRVEAISSHPHLWE